jgi:hypothetical protein
VGRENLVTVRTEVFINAPDGSYAYYPGQVIVDHPDAPAWVARGQAVEIGGRTEKAVMPEEKKADRPTGEISKAEQPETPEKPKPIAVVRPEPKRK